MVNAGGAPYGYDIRRGPGVEKLKGHPPLGNTRQPANGLTKLGAPHKHHI